MHVRIFLHKLLGCAIHKARIKVLSEAITALIKTKQLQLTALGRGIELPIQERSGIQKINRLLGNKHLQEERKAISEGVAHLLIGNKKHPEMIVDWSKYPNSQEGVLRASLSAPGRALTVYEARSEFKRMGNRKFQKKFLQELKTILPAGCQPIIVTDAGFHNDWFKETIKLGWDFVGRIRNVKKYKAEGMKEFKLCRKLFRRGTKIPMSLGKVQLTKQNPLACYFYTVKLSLKGRKARMKNGKIRGDKDSKAYSRSHREPWLLASSLRGRNASKRVVKIYERRMTIEKAFRDLKSTQYGFGLEQGITRRKQRRDILLLLAMLASLIAWLTGKVGEERKVHHQFQSNSIKTRRVLSLFYLGCQMIRKKICLPLSVIWKAATSLQEEINYV